MTGGATSARGNCPADGVRSRKTTANDGTIDPQILATIIATMQPMIDAQTAAISEKLDATLSELKQFRAR